MFVFGLPFNLGNVFGFPLILGAGAEFGLNVVLRYGEARQRGGARLSRSTLFPGLVHGLTTAAGVGGPVIAAHPGLFRPRRLLSLRLVPPLRAPPLLARRRPGGGARLSRRRVPRRPTPRRRSWCCRRGSAARGGRTSVRRAGRRGRRTGPAARGRDPPSALRGTPSPSPGSRTTRA